MRKKYQKEEVVSMPGDTNYRTEIYKNKNEIKNLKKCIFGGKRKVIYCQWLLAYLKSLIEKFMYSYLSMIYERKRENIS